MTEANQTLFDAIYGQPPSAVIADDPTPRIQLSPFQPGASALEALPDASLNTMIVLAPPGSVERRAVLAHALRVLRPGGDLLALAPKDKGGARIAGELTQMGCEPSDDFRRKYRISHARRPEGTLPLADFIAEGAPRLLPDSGLWSQPGVFSWDRLDPGSALLLDALPPLKGTGADFGCGIGILSRSILESNSVTRLAGIDIDRRAIACAERNVTDPRAAFEWADALNHPLSGLDFVVTNPPFHSEGTESRMLGQDFIRAARRALRKGGVCWLVANRHLPYEATLRETFRTVRPHAENGGYKIFEAVA